MPWNNLSRWQPPKSFYNKIYEIDHLNRNILYLSESETKRAKNFVVW